MNSFITRALIVLSGALAQFAQGADDENLVETIKFHAAEIRKSLAVEKWKVRANSDSIVIESKFNVGIQPRINPSIGQKPTPTAYRIELQFKPALSKDEYVKLAKERVEYAAALNYGTKTIDEHEHAARFLKEHPLPLAEVMDEGGKSYSVYANTTDSVFISILPGEKYAEVKGAEALVESIFWPNAR